MKYLIALTLILSFALSSHAQQDIMILKASGKVVIGDITQISTPGPYNLYVQNGVMTEKVKVAVKSEDDWRDSSFALTPTISTVKQSIAEKSHLHNMPAASDLVAEGYDVREMDAHLVEQIEWLWQHTIKLAEENKALRAELEEVKKLAQDEE